MRSTHKPRPGKWEAYAWFWYCVRPYFCHSACNAIMTPINGCNAVCLWIWTQCCLHRSRLLVLWALAMLRLYHKTRECQQRLRVSDGIEEDPIGEFPTRGRRTPTIKSTQRTRYTFRKPT